MERIYDVVNTMFSSIKGLGCLWLPITFLLWLLLPISVYAGPPDLRTPAPVIYLADNLDEKDKLGWCIDTVGRGFSDRLHAHSCKPRGGDVQFYYRESTRRIVSATFSEKCATLSAPAAAGVSLGLLDCSPQSSGQLFIYHRERSEFRPVADSSLCLSVGPTGRRAGPFMSRNLALAPCDLTENKFKQWLIKKKKP